MKFKDRNSNLAKMDVENTRIVGEHFSKVFNRDSKLDWEYVNKTPNKKLIQELAQELTFEELDKAVNALAWHKSPSINRVSPNTLKLLDEPYRRILFRFIKQWMDDSSMIFEE